MKVKRLMDDSGLASQAPTGLLLESDAAGRWSIIGRFSTIAEALVERDAARAEVPEHHRGWWKVKVVDVLGRERVWQ